MGERVFYEKGLILELLKRRFLETALNNIGISTSDIGTVYEDALERVKNWIDEAPPADVKPVVRCKECKFWRDKYIKQNDGVERKYTDKDVDALGIKDSVTLDVGINMGAMCRYEDGRGWRNDKSVFRNEDDFCSRGELRPCSYDEWWGIVDGVYPLRGADMRGGDAE